MTTVLSIDRVHTQMEVLPGAPDVPGSAGNAPPGGSGLLLAREQFRTAVLDVLREHLRELERRGTA